MNITLEEELWLYNWYYNLGEPLVSDIKYNRLFEKLRRENPDSPIITKTWSELGKPVELLERLGLIEESNELEAKLALTGNESGKFMPEDNMQYREKYLKETLEHFEAFVPKSIDTIEDIDSARSWHNDMVTTSEDGTVEYIGMLKADGFNISLYYYDGHFIHAGTRGRTGTSEDVTIAMSKVVPLRIKALSKFMRVKTEAVMNKDSLEELRGLDPSRQWKSPRSSIRTLLTPSMGDEFHKRIIPLAFKLEGGEFDTFKDEFTFLALNGFKVIDHRVFTAKSLTELIEQVRFFSEMEVIYANDGFVVALNKLSEYFKHDTVGKYDMAMRAFRLYSWKSGIYCSLVIGVTPSYNSKNISLGLNIIPTKVSNGSEVSTLDADNPSRLDSANIGIGSVVAFHIRSDSCVDWMTRETVIINSHFRNNTPLPENLQLPVQDLLLRLTEMGVDLNGTTRVTTNTEPKE